MNRSTDQFLTGVLSGLYQGGVGNPAVNEARRRSQLEEAYTQQQMDATASDQGLMKANVDPRTHSVIRDLLFPGSGSPAPKYVQDPNAQVGYVNPQGDLSSTTSEGAIKLSPKDYKSSLIAKSKMPIGGNPVYDAEGNLLRIDFTPRGTKLGAPVKPQPTVVLTQADAAGNVTGATKLNPGEKSGGVIRPTKESATATSNSDAKSRVTDNLKTLKSLYEKLNERGAISNIEKGTGSNVLSRTRSSKLGQFVGGAVGTEDQNIRDQISQIKPLLINDIRQASKMGAKGMDSERELAFYLQAATDPTRSIQSNLAAIKVLDNAYGLGLGFEDSQIPTISSDEEFNALPSGATFLDGNGDQHTKK